MGQSKYTIDREVGRGAFGAVYLAHVKSSGRMVAIKTMRRSKRTGIDWTALREVRLLLELKHPNVVELVDVFALADSMNMVMEFCPFDLGHVIERKTVLLTEEQIKAYIKMSFTGLLAIHERWVLHRDIKPDNLLVGMDRQVKVADLGLAATFGEPDTEDSYKVVTLPYRAPELLFGAREYGVGVDTWAMGCVMAEMMIRRIFLPGANEEDQLAKIFYYFGTPTEKEWPKMASLHKFVLFENKPPRPLKEVFGAAYSADALDLVAALLRVNPANRLSAKDALQHRWFSQGPIARPEDLPFDVFANRGKKDAAA